MSELMHYQSMYENARRENERLKALLREWRKLTPFEVGAYLQQLYERTDKELGQ